MVGDARDPENHDPEKTTVLPEDSFERMAIEPADELRQAVANADARAEEQRNLYLRAVAELDNFRKRAQRDVEQAHKYGLERFAQDLLPVVDSLTAGIESAEAASDRSLIEGQQATQKLLQAALLKHGIDEIDPAGERFNPELHEAIAVQDAAGAAANTILQVVQKGYQLHGRLLRPARVIVARTP
jgi:molecular chaperone GrpE